MNDTNRLMLAIAIALIAYEIYPENWSLIGYLAFFLIAMTSEAIRNIKESVEYFSQDMDQE
jgi:hypothetical protein